jgi:hypothetical protein
LVVILLHYDKWVIDSDHLLKTTGGLLFLLSMNEDDRWITASEFIALRVTYRYYRPMIKRK